MIINTNMASLNTIRQLGVNEKNTQSSLAKLSSGLRINSAADDAAGLAISEKMRGQISGLNQASRNAQNGINMASTAEGALNETTSILQRMRELAVQAGNDTNTTTDRDAMQTEMNQLTSEVNRIGNTTQFNTQNLLDGSASNVTLQIGANTNQTMVFSINDMTASALKISGATSATVSVTANGVTATVTFTGTSVVTDGSNNTSIEAALDISTETNASAAITAIDSAINTVSTERAKLGAYENRLDHTINNLGTSSQNITSAEANIRDVDMASEMTNFQKNNVLQQAAQAMLAQANQQPQGVLQLLR